MTLTQVAAILALLVSFNVPTSIVSNVEGILKAKAVPDATLTAEYLSVQSPYALEAAKEVGYDCSGSWLFSKELGTPIKRTSTFGYAWMIEDPRNTWPGVCKVAVSLQPILGPALTSQRITPGTTAELKWK